jgi:hypothetical protein
MKLKPIEENMVIHCKTEDEAKELIKWAYECGFEWRLANADETHFEIHGETTCYNFKGSMITYCDKSFYKEPMYYVFEFTDLVIPEEHMSAEEPNRMSTMAKLQTDGVIRETMKMSAEEVLKWIKTNFTNRDAYTEVFGCLCAYSSIFTDFTAEEVVSKIESYEAKKKQEKEVEVEWVWKVYNPAEDSDEYYTTEDEAMARCERLEKLWSAIYPEMMTKYEKVCRIKEK